MNINNIYIGIRYGLVGVLTFLSFLSVAQTLVRGVVTDAKTKETLPYVSITIPGTSLGISTDADGKYSMKIGGGYNKITFTYVGYNSLTKVIIPGREQTLNVQLQVSSSRMLNEVVVKSGRRKKYRNKGNPAVELIERVIANKSKNRLESYPYIEYEKYEKLSFALSDITDKFRNKRIFRNYQFLFKNQDSTAIGGTTILPVYMEETLSKNYYRKNPEENKSVILAKNKVDFDPKYIDQQGVSAYLNRMYQDINIYDNNITVISNQFLSPIANSAPTFYLYFITDTVTRGNDKLVELSFAPRNKGDMLFQGKLYITMDGSYAVDNAYLTVHKDINLNFVRQFESRLEFEKNQEDGRYHLSKSTLNINFGISKNKGTGVFGERTVSFKDYKTNVPAPDSIYNGPAVIVAQNEVSKSNLSKEQFWQQKRHEQLSSSERGVYRNIDSLQNMKSFRQTMELVTFLFAGYKSFGPFEVGPANTFYSFNPVEGFRLRLGGRTTPELSKRYYFETYGAYGFKDEKWKYFGSATYSINNKSIYAFPQHYIRTSFQRDTKIPGQELQFVQEDNFLLSFKRGENDRWLYNDLWRIDYVHEFENHFSYNVGFKKWKQTPAGSLRYNNVQNNELHRVENINTSELSLELRYAPNEKFYQGKIYRIPVYGPDPVFTLRYTQGIKGLFDGEYNYGNLTGNIQKRFYLSQLGYTDMTVEGGYIFGQAPFALLAIHRANQTYAYQLNSYNLMNFLEFVSDHYASLNIDHSFNGFFLNKIPLLKKLKLREVVTFKGLYGGIRSENDPLVHPELLTFPTNGEGVRTTYTLEKQPYIEGSVGLANIFKLFRVDLVKRFNYLENPEVSEWGVRARVKFDF
ncbi:carboxypeptidase-like protein [Arcticibacter tournemirensis]|uniref:Carboxypeptidase-like regulatory domain-containing protein n=1 Tax=Arcticibacter tournemirensis TaxID=699437 RepID=A0A4Q0M8H2_9SPHI|nr:DUF5686 and carboxypeptidase-like regulatory domain-containing protein [Arcticibacter tournemirensis]KAA8486767.1 carboxypeptidase-like regulatory domain-containing protein [Arcticibacter tournemirensis]RXF69458.1 carboxypeptidase-like regulatory domain-containing protein [Arcticibacter tournemirensis]TQM49310.1 carboxypeptidase-like protein [Arcticibacter tournemirensis]